jgi:ABC-type glutathione transport system ATPase component
VVRPESSDIGERTDAAAELRRQAAGLVLPRTIALVGLRGAGKTTIGRRLARGGACSTSSSVRTARR